MVVEDDVLDSEASRRLFRLLAPSHGQLTAALRHVSRIAVGHGDEADLVSERGPFGGYAAGADVAVVWMGADGDDSEWRLCVGNGRREQRDKSEQGCGEHAHREPPRDERRFYC